MSETYNLSELMEKRVKSRFSHKLFNVNIEKLEELYNSIGIIFDKERLNNDELIDVNEALVKKILDEEKEGKTTQISNSEPSESDLDAIRVALFNNKQFVKKIEYYFHIGISGVDFLSRLKFLLSQILFEFKKRIEVFIEKCPNYFLKETKHNKNCIEEEFKFKENKYNKKKIDYIPISYEEIQAIVNYKVDYCVVISKENSQRKNYLKFDSR